MGGSQVYSSGGGKGEEPSLEAQAGQVQINTEGVDDLLDEIDGLLENNAEEFVRSYVQKGGQ
ncbi:ubiquitin-like protein Pup [Corynebacterium pelargi]|uniref:Prokaryotic ubiquitin-like protein Pup n=1 Tax=Corynebacterium pelargi TaxID=1471400 RepID=A0A410W8V5_9CORY|nr:ubiquitin-like protein Pup [Corynebacterium pelargi]QAU52387.1 Prokaryotic ubiquitin-like protein Pup [Corynebacterium pelargi]GGG68022.1 prokaryotic ubiquitin-like protein Pup [Corynebacterium pelargi]